MATITEDYVSFETAKLLKEKGFLKEVDLRMTQNLSFYDNIGLSHNLNKYYDRLIQDKIDFVVAPTLQMAMKWLREVHHIFLSIQQHVDMSYVWYAYMDGFAKGCDRESHNNTYEQACETAIKYCLENLIQNNYGNN